jgi:hypothetical protein
VDGDRHLPLPVETKKVMVRVEAELVTSLADTTL